MKKFITLSLLLAAGFVNAQAFKGKGDVKFDVGANIYFYIKRSRLAKLIKVVEM